jgi:catechol 2,3-dioxygenase-like lactoylglutathione lyase family enzyme
MRWIKGGVLLLAGLVPAQAQLQPQPSRPPVTSVSHLAVYASDPGKTEAFYVHDLGAVKRPDPENPAGTRYYFSPVQFVEVLPLPAGAGTGRLDHAAFNVGDAEAMRRYLRAKGVAVPPEVARGADSSRWFKVKDPEGVTIEFVQPPKKKPAIAAGGLSSHIIHVGFIIHDRKLEDGFYRDLLGFRPYWFGGGRDDGPPSWISQQMPDGPDWLEYMIPTNPVLTQAQTGVLNHFALGVRNMEAAYTKLWNQDRLQGQVDARGQQTVPKIGRDAKWQLNLIDPDGTRAEVMELHAIGKPCCSPFTAADPEN